MEKRQEVDEERETCPRAQHQHEAREDEIGWRPGVRDDP